MPPIDEDQQRLDGLLDRLEAQTPKSVGNAIHWIRTPAARWVRIPAGLLLIVGGLLSFLPVLGLWMLPLGLLLLALDIPFLKGPVGKSLVWAEQKWDRWHNRNNH